MAPAIELRGVSRIYGSGHTQVIALHPTHLLVHRGELVAVMGPSGSGKSTLLSLVGGLDRPTAARALVITALAAILAIPAGLLPVGAALYLREWPIVVPLPEIAGVLLVLPLVAAIGGLMLGRPLPDWSARRG